MPFSVFMERTRLHTMLVLACMLVFLGDNFQHVMGLSLEATCTKGPWGRETYPFHVRYKVKMCGWGDEIDGCGNGLRDNINLCGYEVRWHCDRQTDIGNDYNLAVLLLKNP